MRIDINTFVAESHRWRADHLQIYMVRGGGSRRSQHGPDWEHRLSYWTSPARRLRS